MAMTSWFSEITPSANFFDDVFFPLTGLVTLPSSMPISPLVLELWQFPFTKDWSQIRKSEIPPSEFCLIPADSGKLRIPNLIETSLIECYWMLENSRVIASAIYELLRENQ